MSATCRSCSAGIEWATTVPADRKVPLDLIPVNHDERGALILVGRHAYALEELVERLALKEAVSTTRARELIRERYDARLSHFATCPDADRHRRR